jgi:hypothetical protein
MQPLRYVLVLLLAVGLVGCDEAGVSPQSSATPENTFEDNRSYRQFLGKIYGGLVLTGQEGPAGNPDLQLIDEGFSQYMRVYWQLQELPTDEAVLAWGDEGVQPLNQQQWTPSNPFVEAMYNRVYFQAAMANEFLRQTTPEKLDQRGVDGDLRQQIQQFRAEARFLRALSYWHGLDLFGDIPLVTEESAVGLQAPDQNTREEVFSFVESELTAITDSEGDETLPPVGQAEYGRADQGAAYMVLAKLYLNAEVYTGTARYGDAIDATEQIIDSGAYTLEENYQELFLADNHTANGIIFSIPQDGERTQNFGGTTFLGHASIGGGTMNAADYGFNFGWWGLRTTENVVNRFPDLSGEADTRGIFFAEKQSVAINSLTDFTQGIAVPKFRNVTSGCEPAGYVIPEENDIPACRAGANSEFPDIDFPLFRLADAYLMYAEATLRGGGGSESKAQSLVNDLRERAGMGRDVGTDDGPSLTLDFLLEERSRELLWEASRRTDLVRYEQFTVSGTWPWKGGQQEGTTTSGNLDLYPIPQSQLQVNDNLEQNPGY